MLQLSRALALTLLIVSSAFGDGGFLTSCDPDSIEIDGTILTASCLNVFKESKCSRLDLGSCFKNDYGSIQNDPSGNGPSISRECTNCSNSPTTGGFIIGKAPSMLHCQCDNYLGYPKSRWPTAMIDINAVIDNANGILRCHETSGEEC